MDEQDHYNYLRVMEVSKAVIEAMAESKKKGDARSRDSEIFKNICILALSHKFRSNDDMKIWVNLMADKCRDADGDITLLKESRSCGLCLDQ